MHTGCHIPHGVCQVPPGVYGQDTMVSERTTIPSTISWPSTSLISDIAGVHMQSALEPT